MIGAVQRCLPICDRASTSLAGGAEIYPSRPFKSSKPHSLGKPHGRILPTASTPTHSSRALAATSLPTAGGPSAPYDPLSSAFGARISCK